MNLKTVFPALLALALAACSTPAQPGPGPDPKPEPTPVGTPIGTPVSKTIGAAGGTLSSADGKITVEVPAGAFAKDETVSVQEIENHAQSKVGKAFRLTPEGVKFAKPVTLTFALSESEAAGAEDLRVAYQTKEGLWALPKAQRFDPATRRLSVETTHFSDWSAVAGMQLLPGEGKLKPGQSLTLQIGTCFVEDTPNNPLDDIGVCDKLSMRGQPLEWSVNGVRGGSAAVGTLTVDSVNGSAVYTAPAKAPAQNPVAVSVEWSHPEIGTIVVVANIKIEAASDWQGTVTYTEHGTKVVPAPQYHTGSIVHTYSHSETLEVVGVKEVNGKRTTLLLRSTSKILLDRTGATRGEHWGGCYVNEAPILRELRIYSIQMRLEGTGSKTVEAELYIDDGQYSLYAEMQGAQIKGKEVVEEKHTYFCLGKEWDGSYTKDYDTPWGGHSDLKIQGALSGDGTRLSGGYRKSGDEWLIPTEVKVDWNLTNGR